MRHGHEMTSPSRIHWLTRLLLAERENWRLMTICPNRGNGLHHQYLSTLVREAAVRKPAVREPATRNPATREPVARKREPAARKPVARNALLINMSNWPGTM